MCGVVQMCGCKGVIAGSSVFMIVCRALTRERKFWI